MKYHNSIISGDYHLRNDFCIISSLTNSRIFWLKEKNVKNCIHEGNQIAGIYSKWHDKFSTLLLFKGTRQQQIAYLYTIILIKYLD